MTLLGTFFSRFVLFFQKPLPHPGWRGVATFRQYRPGCPQFDSRGTVYGQEDCLYMNVYVPYVDVSCFRFLRLILLNNHFATRNPIFSSQFESTLSLVKRENKWPTFSESGCCGLISIDSHVLGSLLLISLKVIASVNSTNHRISVKVTFFYDHFARNHNFSATR